MIRGMVDYQAPALRVAVQEDVKRGEVDIAIGFADLWLLPLDKLDALIEAQASDTVH